jgi:hypothetical protein
MPYWISEAWYGEKKYENAILQFQDVIQKYGDHPSPPLPRSRVTFTFWVTKRTPGSFQKLIDSFPLSEEAKKAKEKLAEWKVLTPARKASSGAVIRPPSFVVSWFSSCSSGKTGYAEISGERQP